MRIKQEKIIRQLRNASFAFKSYKKAELDYFYRQDDVTRKTFESKRKIYEIKANKVRM